MADCPSTAAARDEAGAAGGIRPAVTAEPYTAPPTRKQALDLLAALSPDTHAEVLGEASLQHITDPSGREEPAPGRPRNRYNTAALILHRGSARQAATLLRNAGASVLRARLVASASGYQIKPQHVADVRAEAVEVAAMLRELVAQLDAIEGKPRAVPS